MPLLAELFDAERANKDVVVMPPLAAWRLIPPAPPEAAVEVEEREEEAKPSVVMSPWAA